MSFDIQTDSLLTIEDICSKLSISRRTFDRFRGTASPTSPGLAAIASRGGGPALSLPRHMNPLITAERELASAPPFPEPTCMIGRSPRWSAKTINAWLTSAGR